MFTASVRYTVQADRDLNEAKHAAQLRISDLTRLLDESQRREALVAEEVRDIRTDRGRLLLERDQAVATAVDLSQKLALSESLCKRLQSDLNECKRRADIASEIEVRTDEAIKEAKQVLARSRPASSVTRSEAPSAATQAAWREQGMLSAGTKLTEVADVTEHPGQ
ncbi:hypothetical protein M427DRAFT_56428 [Gonapodya prolifera JEL478]|uniref:Uncharacterized protein n=1 Tax=Gonapodya prolifera (strain JEL478) TaxID=1344416 RepID=A0A139AGB4_GONPJ|nr:hypothetical protein M427DRAFT_56428 [Gonapodya prolifera JEL478]|eukprot:KXS15851.1 hypothetical protein M427DRAFT_56428 [Gonapodya prolifera JEL478]